MKTITRNTSLANQIMRLLSDTQAMVENFLQTMTGLIASVASQRALSVGWVNEAA